MKVYLVNDCTFWPGWQGGPGVTHHGCKAIIQSLSKRITNAGHTIIGVCKRPDGPTPELVEECDMMIVNGEGTFRDEALDHEPGRLMRLFNGMKRAKLKGKKVYLVNTVWCNMGKHWRDLLCWLDGISTREPESARLISELTEGRAKSEIHPDESFFLNAPATTDPIGGTRVAVGDFYTFNSLDSVDYDHPAFSGAKHIGLFNTDWVSAVQQIRFADIYVTGQHHGVYAACKARTPFAVMRVNTHKLTSLFEWAGVTIPIAHDAPSLRLAMQWAIESPQVFGKLFTFLEGQKPWQIPV